MTKFGVNTHRKSVAIIPARGRSKAVPRKNIQLLAGKPLITYTIEAALEANELDRVIVSTDDAEIAGVAKEYAVEVIIRPGELSTDIASTELVLQHVVSILESTGVFVDIIVLLQPTSPLRSSRDIDSAIQLFLHSGVNSLLSASKFAGFLWKETQKGNWEPINYDFKDRPRRQDLNQYLENGAIYITEKDLLMSQNCRLGGRIGLYVMDPQNSIEIDTLFDLYLAEQILSHRRAES